MKTVLVTGGLGYIGAHTAVVLLERGYNVVLVDNLDNTRAEVLDGIEAIAGIRPRWDNVDLSDAAAVEAWWPTLPHVDGIVHFAAHKAVGESVAQPLKYYRNNLMSQALLLERVAHKPETAFLFSSSCTVYGQAEHLPIAEGSPILPAESPYGNTKQIGEEMLRDAARAHGFHAIALRYFNPIGAHPSALIGELPLGVPQNLVPFVTQTAAGIRPALSVFGNDYPTRDGTAIRDYIHVVDLAEAHAVALERLLDRTSEEPVEVFNLGTGTGSTVLEVIQSFERSTGATLPWNFAPRRPGDVVAAYADTAKAERVLGWKTKRTLDEAMADAWRWQQHVLKSTSSI